MQLSIVTTLYGSAPHLDEFRARVRAAADRLAVPYEIVMVNDGSTDGSLEAAIRLAAGDPHIRVADLSRRYGHYEAILAGIRLTAGQIVFVIDSDLEEPPELLDTLWAALHEDAACDLVVACHARRRLRSIPDLGGWLYYRMLRAQTGLDIPRDNFVARIMTRRYADALIAMRERPISFDALSGRVGFGHRILPAVKGSRPATTYPLSRRVRLFVDSMLAYGSKAASIFAYAAIAVAAMGLWAFWTSAATLRLVAIVAATVVIVGIATLCRYLDLLFEEIRYTPPHVRRIYPDE